LECLRALPFLFGFDVIVPTLGSDETSFVLTGYRKYFRRWFSSPLFMPHVLDYSPHFPSQIAFFSPLDHLPLEDFPSDTEEATPQGNLGPFATNHNHRLQWVPVIIFSLFHPRYFIYVRAQGLLIKLPPVVLRVPGWSNACVLS